MGSTKMSVMHEISKTEDALKTVYLRIYALEQKLKDHSMSQNKKNEFKRELKDVKKLLKTHEDQLAHLRTHNRLTFAIAVVLIIIIFGFYMLYILVWNPSS